MISDDLDQNIEMAHQCLAIFRMLGDQPGMAQAYNFLGELVRSSEDLDAAQHYYEESLRIAQLCGDRLREAVEFLNMGSIAYFRDQYQESADLLRRGMSACRDSYAIYCLLTGLALLAGPVAKLGDPERAARLLGAADAGLDSLGVYQQLVDQNDIDKFHTSIRQTLGEEAFHEAWQVGYEMSLDEAVEYALTL